MRRAGLLLLCVLTALGGPGALLAQDWFVNAATGADANAGTTSGTAFRSITRAMAAAAPGETVFVAAGVYDDTANPAGNESFPIPLADGVILQGPAAGTARVDATGFLGAAFAVGALASPTVISGLTIDAHAAAGTGVLCTDVPASLQLLGNTFTGGNGVRNFDGLVAGGGSVNLVLSGNAFSNAGTAVLWVASEVAGPHTVVARNNSVAGGDEGIVLYAFASSVGAGGALLNATLSSNVVASVAGAGIKVSAVNGLPGVSVRLNATADGNTLTGCDTGLLVFASGFGVSAFARVDLLAVSNAIAGGGDGASLIAGAGSGATAVIQGTWECNQLETHSGDGLRFFALASGASGLIDAAFRYNEITGNSGTGVSGTVLVSGQLLGSFTGNCITGNGGDGVALGSSSFGATPVVAPDFGGGGSTGRNTIEGNNQGGGAFDFDLGGVAAGTTILARGNFWGATSAAGIEALVRDAADSAAFADLDFTPALADPLVFTLAPTSAAPGTLVTVTPGAAAAFVAKAGGRVIRVTADGTPVDSLSVAADGTLLSFLVPAGLAAGTIPVRVDNPCGQSGTALLIIPAAGPPVFVPPLGASNGGCFIATAAWGSARAPEVQWLRRFRDTRLAGNPLGRLAVRAYYAASPPLAAAIAERPWARALARAALAPVAGAARLGTEAPWLLPLAAAVLLLRALRRRR